MASTKVDPEETFVKAIRENPVYKSVIGDNLEYEIYVQRQGLWDNLHHRIVLRAVERDQFRLGQGYITLELGKDGNRVTAKSVMLPQDVKYPLEPKGTFTDTLENIAKFAMAILTDMGDYALAGNNCQNFCNYFLESVGKEQYYTTLKLVAGVGAGVGAGVVLAAALTKCLKGRN